MPDPRQKPRVIGAGKRVALSEAARAVYKTPGGRVVSSRKTGSTWWYLVALDGQSAEELIRDAHLTEER